MIPSKPQVFVDLDRPSASSLKRMNAATVINGPVRPDRGTYAFSISSSLDRPNIDERLTLSHSKIQHSTPLTSRVGDEEPQPALEVSGLVDREDLVRGRSSTASHNEDSRYRPTSRAGPGVFHLGANQGDGSALVRDRSSIAFHNEDSGYGYGSTSRAGPVVLPLGANQGYGSRDHASVAIPYRYEPSSGAVPQHSGYNSNSQNRHCYPPSHGYELSSGASPGVQHSGYNSDSQNRHCWPRSHVFELSSGASPDAQHYAQHSGYNSNSQNRHCYPQSHVLQSSNHHSTLENSNWSNRSIIESNPEAVVCFPQNSHAIYPPHPVRSGFVGHTGLQTRSQKSKAPSLNIPGREVSQDPPSGNDPNLYAETAGFSSLPSQASNFQASNLASQQEKSGVDHTRGYRPLISKPGSSRQNTAVPKPNARKRMRAKSPEYKSMLSNGFDNDIMRVNGRERSPPLAIQAKSVFGVFVPVIVPAPAKQSERGGTQGRGKTTRRRGDEVFEVRSRASNKSVGQNVRPRLTASQAKSYSHYPPATAVPSVEYDQTNEELLPVGISDPMNGRQEVVRSNQVASEVHWDVNNNEFDDVINDRFMVPAPKKAGRNGLHPTNFPLRDTHSSSTSTSLQNSLLSQTRSAASLPRCSTSNSTTIPGFMSTSNFGCEPVRRINSTKQGTVNNTASIDLRKLPTASYAESMPVLNHQIRGISTTQLNTTPLQIEPSTILGAPRAIEEDLGTEETATADDDDDDGSLFGPLSREGSPIESQSGAEDDPGTATATNDVGPFGPLSREVSPIELQPASEEGPNTEDVNADNQFAHSSGEISAGQLQDAEDEEFNLEQMIADEMGGNEQIANSETHPIHDVQPILATLPAPDSSNLSAIRAAQRRSRSQRKQRTMTREQRAEEIDRISKNRTLNFFAEAPIRDWMKNRTSLPHEYQPPVSLPSARRRSAPSSTRRTGGSFTEGIRGEAIDLVSDDEEDADADDAMVEELRGNQGNRHPEGGFNGSSEREVISLDSDDEDGEAIVGEESGGHEYIQDPRNSQQPYAGSSRSTGSPQATTGNTSSQPYLSPTAAHTGLSRSTSIPQTSTEHTYGQTYPSPTAAYSSDLAFTRQSHSSPSHSSPLHSSPSHSSPSPSSQFTSDSTNQRKRKRDAENDGNDAERLLQENGELREQLARALAGQESNPTQVNSRRRTPAAPAPPAPGASMAETESFDTWVNVNLTNRNYKGLTKYSLREEIERRGLRKLNARASKPALINLLVQDDEENQRAPWGGEPGSG